MGLFEHKICVTNPGDTNFSLFQTIKVSKFLAENQRMELVGGEFAEGIEMPWQNILVKCEDKWHISSPFTGELMPISEPIKFIQHCISYKRFEKACKLLEKFNFAPVRKEVVRDTFSYKGEDIWFNLWDIPHENWPELGEIFRVGTNVGKCTARYINIEFKEAIFYMELEQ